jgi:hypothetical protein
MDILLNAFEDGFPALCTASNVSEGGLGLRRVHDARSQGSGVVDLEFMLPGSDEVILARGRLRGDREEPGVVFDWLPEAHRDLIREFVSAD